MNNNMGPLEGQNLNPNATSSESLNQPSINGGIQPTPPVTEAQPAPTPEAAAMPATPVSPVTPVTPVTPIVPTPTPVEPVGNVAPLPSIAPTPTPVPVTPAVSPVENLEESNSSTPIEPVSPVPGVSPVTPVSPITPVTPVTPGPTVVQPVTITPVPESNSTTPSTPENNNSTPPPTLDNNTPQAEPGEEKTKSKSMKPAVIGIVLVLVVVVGGVVGMKFLGNKDKGGNNPSNPISQGNTTQVNYNGYTYTVPETMTYAITEDSLMISDKDNKWIIFMNGPIAGDYNFLKENKSEFETSISSDGNNFSNGDVKTYEGVEYLTYEGVDLEGTKMLVACTPIGSKGVLIIGAHSTSNQIDYGILEKLTPIISSAKEYSISSALELPEDNNILDIIKEQISKQSGAETPEQNPEEKPEETPEQKPEDNSEQNTDQAPNQNPEEEKN